MIIESIRLENFGMFVGKHKVEFDKGLNLVHAPNGSGKTTLWWSIGWVFDSDFKIYDPGKNVPRVMTPIPWHLNVYEKDTPAVRTSVEIDYIDQESGQRTTVGRVLNATRQDDGKLAQQGRTIMSVLEEDIASGIQRVIPNEVYMAKFNKTAREFFQYNGDKSCQSALTNSTQFKHSVRELLGTNTARAAKDWNNGLAARYENQLGDETGAEGKRIAESINTLRKEQERLALERDNAKKNLENKTESLNTLLRWAETQKELFEFREARQKESDVKVRAEAVRKSSEDSIRKMIPKAYWAIANNIPEIGRAVKELRERKVNQRIPSEIRAGYIEALIKEKKCICGREIGIGTPEEKELKGLANEEMDRFGDQMVYALPVLNSADELASSTMASLNEAITRMKDVNNELFAAREERKSAQQRIPSDVTPPSEENEGGEDDLVTNFQQRVTTLQNDIAELERVITVCNDRIKAGIKPRQRAEENLADVSRKKGKGENSRARMEFILAANELLVDSIQTVESDAAKLFEKTANEIRQEIFQNREDRFEVKINPDFLISTLNIDDADLEGDGSTGQLNVLGYSTLLAIGRHTGLQMPLLADNPFAGMGGAFKNAIVEKLPDAYDQVILFCHDSEIHPRDREAWVREDWWIKLSPTELTIVQKENEIDPEKAGYCSVIQQGYIEEVMRTAAAMRRQEIPVVSID